MLPVITIDGPSGSGKGTLAAKTAAHYGFHLLDSGALYRLLALSAFSDASSIETIGSPQEQALIHCAYNMNIAFEPHDSGMCVYLDNQDVTQRIRQEDIGLLASKIASYKEVRHALLARQRVFVQPPGLVADGRDMGTVVFPEATIKFFLTASVDARAQRRLKQLQQSGIDANLSTIFADLQARDKRDSERVVAPLMPAADAIYIDASNLTVDAVFEQMQHSIDAKII